MNRWQGSLLSGLEFDLTPPVENRALNRERDRPRA
jgi:hypothetical protein